MKLKEMRQKFNETQEDAAKSVGVSLSSWQKAEYGLRKPSDPVKIRMANHYGVSVGYLFFDEPITYSNKESVSQ